MTTLLVGLDNPHSNRPQFALFPYPDHATGHRLVELIRGHVGRYSKTNYLRDFMRTNLYGARRAPEGPGSRAADQDAIAQVAVMAEQLGARDVVLLGLRTVAAFNALYGENLEWLQCRVLAEGPRRWWALPHPSGRNRWYNIDENREAAGKLLASLRGTARRLEVANG